MSTMTHQRGAWGKTRSISRRLLRHEIRRELLDALLSGRLAGGEQVTEAGLASELGVSRTPLREALFGLEQDGFFESRNGKGLTVRPLTADEVREVYPILAALEDLAVRASVALTGSVARKCQLLLEELVRAAARGDGTDALELESRWSELLLSGCTNEQLLGEIERLRDRALRYELAYARDWGAPPRDVEGHRAVLELVLRERRREAGHSLGELRLSTVAKLVEWLEE